MELEIDRKGMEKKFYEALLPIVREQGFQLYDLEYIKGNSTLRVYIMDEKTKTAQIEDCVAVDRALSPVFETNDWIPSDIVLEVSSPGLYRNLRSREHLDLSLEQVVCAKISGKIDESMMNNPIKELNGKNKVRGVLSKYDNEKLYINYDGIEVVIPINKIKKINLDPDI